MRKIVKGLLAAASLLGIGTALLPDGVEAATFAELKQRADEACDEALRIGTVEALEDYLRKYWWASNECRARAQNAISQQERGDNQNSARDYFLDNNQRSAYQ